MADLNNLEEAFESNTQEPNLNKIQEPYKDNFQDQTNISVPDENNVIQRQNNIPEPYKNNIQEPYQYDKPGPYQINDSDTFQNKIYIKDLNQGIANEELNKKEKCFKAIFLTILIIIFISEIAVYFISFSIIGKPPEHSNPEHSYFGEGLEAALLLIIVFPLLIILSSFILCFNCFRGFPIMKIVIIIILGALIGFIATVFFDTDRENANIIAILLESLNFLYIIVSVSYQITIKIYSFN